VRPSRNGMRPWKGCRPKSPKLTWRQPLKELGLILRGTG
jgi:hypothetical protein